MDKLKDREIPIYSNDGVPLGFIYFIPEPKQVVSWRFEGEMLVKNRLKGSEHAVFKSPL